MVVEPILLTCIFIFLDFGTKFAYTDFIMKETLFGRILLAHSLITDTQLAEALDIQRETYPPRPLGEILLEKGYITKEELERCLSIQKRRFEFGDIKGPLLRTQEIYERLRNAEVRDFLKLTIDMKANELYLSSKIRPFVRLYGNIIDLHHPPLDIERCKELIFGILTDEEIDHYYGKRSVEVCRTIEGIGRFRINVFRHLRGITGFFKVIPETVPPFESLGLPEIIKSLVELPRGLVLVTGPKASGKTTTLAAMVELINTRRMRRIITIEHPIEYIIPSKKSLIAQREIGVHTRSFSSALRSVLREDPDVIIIGEMRDLETISTALTAAETGHLVIGTLHTQNALHTITRIMDAYPADKRNQIRVMLSGSLKAIISQQLIPNVDGRSQSLACEILVVNYAIANMIREARLQQLPVVMQTGKSEGMMVMDDSLYRLWREGKISTDEATSRAVTPSRFLKKG